MVERFADAITEAIKYCKEHNVLQPFMINNASEVQHMLSTEFKMEEAIEVWKEEGFEEGFEEGRKEEQKRILGLLRSGHNIDEIEKILQQEREGKN